MNPITYALAFVIIVFLVYVGRFSGRLRVERRRFIAAPAELVYASVHDFSTWAHWNPWSAFRPLAVLEVGKSGKSLRWQGDGEGEIRALRQQEGRRITQHWQVQAPFRYRGKVEWLFAPVEGGVEVTWRFRGRVSFGLRAFARTVQGVADFDARYALDRLSAWLAPGEADYRLEFEGIREFPALSLVGVSDEAKNEKLAARQPAAWASLDARLSDNALLASGEGRVLFLSTNLKTGVVRSIYGYPVAAAPALPSPLVRREIPACQAVSVRFAGRPEDLDLAWYQAMQYLRAEGMSPHPSIPPAEIYLSAAGQAGAPAHYQLCLPILPA